MPDREINGKGFRVIFKSGTVSKLIGQAVVDGLNEVGRKYYAAIIKNVSLTDHDLQDLKELGYPYARNTDAEPVHEDDRLVHIQSGELLAGLKLIPAVAETNRTYSTHVTSDVPYTEYLLNGTSRMRPRRFDEKAYEDIGGAKAFDDLVERLRGLKYRIGN